MCGIAGILNLDYESAPHQTVTGMTQVLASGCPVVVRVLVVDAVFGSGAGPS